MKFVRLNRSETVALTLTLFLICSTAQATDQFNMERKVTLNAAASDVWAFIGNWDDIIKLVDSAERVDTIGDEVGAMRTVTLSDGAVIKERLEKLDEMSYSFVLTDSNFPVSEYTATLSVTDLGEDRAEFHWAGTFRPNGVCPQEAESLFLGLYVSF